MKSGRPSLSESAPIVSIRSKIPSLSLSKSQPGSNKDTSQASRGGSLESNGLVPPPTSLALLRPSRSSSNAVSYSSPLTIIVAPLPTLMVRFSEATRTCCSALSKNSTATKGSLFSFTVVEPRQISPSRVSKISTLLTLAIASTEARLSSDASSKTEGTANCNCKGTLTGGAGGSVGSKGSVPKERSSRFD